MEKTEVYPFLLEFSQRLHKVEEALQLSVDHGSVLRCGSSLRKNELFHFLYALMEEGILYFDPRHPEINRRCFQRFAEEHFTYSGAQGQQVPVRRASRHFSEAKGFTYLEGHLRALEKIIQLLEARRTRLVGN